MPRALAAGQRHGNIVIYTLLNEKYRGEKRKEYKEIETMLNEKYS
jgi:hypothetical protein